MSKSRLCPTARVAAFVAILGAVFFVVLITASSSAPAQRGGKLTEDELIALKQPRDLLGPSWQLPPMGGPLATRPGVTRDGIQLAAVFYPGNVNKETVPVILMHGARGSRSDFRSLIDTLQPAGMAIMAADFRGHGGSNKQYRFDELTLRQMEEGADRDGRRGPSPDRPSPSPKLEDIQAEDLQPKDYAAMLNDLMLVRAYMNVQNDRGLLNMNRLVLVGSDTGASLAAIWALQDWAKGASRETKALILVAPSPLAVDHDIAKYFERAGKQFKENVNLLIIVPSRDNAASANAAKIKNALMSTKDLADDPPGFASRVPIITVDTDKTGAELFADKDAGVGKIIDDFIKDRFGKYRPNEYKWTKRR